MLIMQILEITGLDRILFVANISGLLYNLQKYDFKKTPQLCRVTRKKLVGAKSQLPEIHKCNKIGETAFLNDSDRAVPSISYANGRSLMN